MGSKILPASRHDYRGGRNFVPLLLVACLTTLFIPVEIRAQVQPRVVVGAIDGETDTSCRDINFPPACNCFHPTSFTAAGPFSNSTCAPASVSGQLEIIQGQFGVRKIRFTGTASAPEGAPQVSAGAHLDLDYEILDGAFFVTEFQHKTTTVGGQVFQDQTEGPFTDIDEGGPGFILESFGATHDQRFPPFDQSVFTTFTYELEFEPVDPPCGNELHWANAAGGSYNVGSNWDPSCFPVDDGVRHDVAVFDLNTGSPVPISAAAATGAQWRFADGTYQVTGPAQLSGAVSGGSALDISNGAHFQWTSGTLTVGGTAFIGSAAGPFSFMDVVNSGASLQQQGVLIVENGMLDVNSGGSVSTLEGSVGGVFGHGPARLRVAGVSSGTPSAVQMSGLLTVGVGPFPTGELSVLDGAFVRADEIRIEKTALVKGSATPNNPSDTSKFAALSADSTLTVGGENQGLLTVEKGGAAQAPTVFVDAVGSGTGRIVVDGQGEFAVLNALDNLTVVSTEQVEVEVKGGGVLQAQAVNLGSAQVRPGAADLTIRGRTSSNADPSKLRVFDVPSAPGPAGLTAVGATAEGQLSILEGATADLGGGL